MATIANHGVDEFTLPRGQIMVSRSKGAIASPRASRMFGRDLVIGCGACGWAVTLDADRPNIKAHLAAEQTSDAATHRMERDIIGCPDHAWRFGSDGRCDNIAHFAGPIPASARVSACSVAERFGGVFAWHDLEEAAPEFDLSQPPQRGRPRWIQSEFDDLGATAIHPQEIAANIADPGRFELSHGQILHDFGNTDVGVIARQRSGATKP